MSSSNPATASLNWRAVLKIHPAADLFPLMSEAALKELAEDIKNHGLQTPIVIYETSKFSRQLQRDEQFQVLLDGRNRLDALALLGMLDVDDDGELCLNKWWNKYQWVASDKYGNPPLATNELNSGDPYALALSLNIHRRHLTAEQKRDLIAKVLKAKPEASNRQIAEQVKADDKTVGKVRTKLEATAEIPKLKKTIGKDGKARKQPASKVMRFKAGGLTVAMHMPPDDTSKSKPAASAEVSIEQRKAEMAALDGASNPRTAEDAKHEAAGKDLAAKNLAEFSAKQLAEFKHACNLRLPIMSPQHLQEAIAYCTGFAEPDAEMSRSLHA